MARNYGNNSNTGSSIVSLSNYNSAPKAVPSKPKEVNNALIENDQYTVDNILFARQIQPIALLLGFVNCAITLLPILQIAQLFCYQPVEQNRAIKVLLEQTKI